MDEAQSTADRALTISSDPRVRADILLENETIASRRANRAAQESALAALRALAESLGDPELQRIILLRRIEFALNVSDTATLETAIRELKACTPHDDAHWIGKLHIADAKLAFLLGRLAESNAAAQAALECARASNNSAAAAEALCSLATVEAHRGNLSEAEALFDEAARATDDPVLEDLSIASAFQIAYNRRDLERCLTLGQRWLDLAEASGDRRSEARAHSHLGIALSAAGAQYAQAREHIAYAVRFFTEVGDVSGTAAQLLNQAVIEARLGFFDKAVAATERAVTLFESLNDGRGRAIGLGNLGLFRAYTTDVEGAQKAAREAVALARQLEFGVIEASSLENLAFAGAAAGDLTEAIAHAEAALEVRARSQSEGWASKTLADLAVWHAASGNLRAAGDYMRRMLADEKSILASSGPEYCYWAAAQIFHLESKTPEAARALARARQMIAATADGLDPADRASFESIPWNSDVAAAARGAWPDPPR
ncbi:MAG: hypothetical protein ABSD52_11300 [Candidatus Cybelea sp.]